jgi:hypothetical protein
MINPVETYLKDLNEIRRTGGGTAEESYYGALETLLNEIGKKLNPKVRCVQALKNIGAGEPDFGLYTQNQLQNAQNNQPMKGQPPERGVIECKPWIDDSFARTESAQVTNYWNKYGLVLVTNFHDFLLIGRDTHGKPIRLESYSMAESINAFHTQLVHPHRTSVEQGNRLIEFLRRVMLHNAPLTTPEDLAWFLASYAREARFRVEEAADLPALGSLKKALEDALGMKFRGDKGEHFFRATLVQTLFYGVFSSWVLWSRDYSGEPNARFSWREASWTLHVPMITTLFTQIATPQKLKPLGVDEVLDWAGLALNRVNRNAFFAKFDEGYAVQYFYEPFLKAYDPELRKELGVWFTPPEIVKYQVERVDYVLREELGISDGLADEQVVVLDPCCGTGAYLVEVLKRINSTLDEKGNSALTAQKLKHAAMQRVFGFEILPAPFVVSHLQMGLMLRLLGAPLNRDSDERVGIYLTNALTGWEPREKPKDELPLFPELFEERDRANKVKRISPILVVIGNPPYNAFAGTSPEEEGGLVEPYKEGLTKPIKDGGWGIKKFNLDELYVRFFRIAERRIIKSGKGIISYISNFSYVGDQSFVVMRRRYLEEFDRIWIDCMNGDSRETGKLTPDGKPDPSVFSTGQNPAGIRVGTAICVMVRKAKRASKTRVMFQHYWGTDKRKELLDSLNRKNFDQNYKIVEPIVTNRFSFRPSSVGGSYLKWPSLLNLSEIQPLQGLDEDRKFDLISIEKETLRERMQKYFDMSVKWEELKSSCNGLTRDSAGFSAQETRNKITKIESFSENRLSRFLLRPFDTRWCYLSTVSPLWKRSRPDYQAQIWAGNSFILSRPTGVASPEGKATLYSETITSRDSIRGHAIAFPIFIRYASKKRKYHHVMDDMFGYGDVAITAKANLSKTARAYLADLNISDPDKNIEMAGLIWMHVLAMSYSPMYLAENADGIRENWPRIPLSKNRKVLLSSVDLGRRVAALLNTEKPVAGITAGQIDPLLKPIGVISKVGGGSLNPDTGELDITAGWGYMGKDGVCMPGKGKIDCRRQKEKGLKKTFGPKTLDIFLNDVAYWANVPYAVWDYHIGGYQVIKKLLSYREKTILGRGLEIKEAEYVTEMVRRIAALINLQPVLDANYEAAKNDTWPWPEE